MSQLLGILAAAALASCGGGCGNLLPGVVINAPGNVNVYVTEAH